MADIPPHDPRVYFAAERTLLAWVRTGLTIMAFGFVVARFGLFLRLLQGQGSDAVPPGSRVSPYLGAGLVLLGVLVTGFGAVDFRRYCRRIAPADLPSPRAGLIPLLLVSALVVAGAILVWVLLR